MTQLIDRNNCGTSELDEAAGQKHWAYFDKTDRQLEVIAEKNASVNYIGKLELIYPNTECKVYLNGYFWSSIGRERE